jgi:hypothetical protein
MRLALPARLKARILLKCLPYRRGPAGNHSQNDEHRLQALLRVSLVSTLATVLLAERPNAWLPLGSFIPAMIICLVSIGFFRMNTAIKQGRLDAFAGEEPPETSVSPVSDHPSSRPLDESRRMEHVPRADAPSVADSGHGRV